LSRPSSALELSHPPNRIIFEDLSLYAWLH
jgi:hypothetical protein